MYRLLLSLLLLAAFPTFAQSERIASLESNGRTLRVSLDDGYVRCSEHDSKFFGTISDLMNSGKVELIEVLATEEDIKRTDEGLDNHSMLYKIATDAMYGTSIVDERAWLAAKPKYQAAIVGMDLEEVNARLQKRVDDFMDRQLDPEVAEVAEAAGFEFRMGEFSKPVLYRSDASSFRFHATVPATIILGGEADKTLYLGFGAVVYLSGRVYLIAGEVVAPKDTDGFMEARDRFERFIDRIVALNGAITRG